VLCVVALAARGASKKARRGSIALYELVTPARNLCSIQSLGETSVL